MLSSTPTSSRSCSTCTGACCERDWVIPVRPSDVAALPPGSYEKGTVGPQWAGEMRKTPGGACVLFRGGLCSAYDARPQACTDWPVDCELYVADPAKISGLG